MVRFSVVFMFLIILTGCEGKVVTEAELVNKNNDNGSTLFTFTDIQTQVFNKTCAISGCHTGPNPQSGLDLSVGLAYSNIVNKSSLENSSLKLIDPGNSADSYLIRKLRGQNISGNRMPNGRPALSTSVINSIANWVDAGAPNN